MTTELMAMMAAYFLCNAEAEVRVLAQHEAQQCIEYQTAIKIDLLDDVSVDDYAVMTTAERAAFGRRGYQAYLEWKSDHPDLVEELEAMTRSVAVQNNS